MLSALTIIHSLVPPHPAPAAASLLFGADLGRTILWGLAVSIPTSIMGGIVYGFWIARRIDVPAPEIAAAVMPRGEPKLKAPSLPAVVLLLLMPVALIFGATLANTWQVPLRGATVFIGHPFTALTITTLAAIYFFGIRLGIPRDKIARMAAESLAPMGALLCIMGGGGALKQIIVDSGVGTYAGKLLITSSVSPLIVAFLIATAMRIAQGSATVAIITAAGIVAPIVKGIPGYSPDILVLALCLGGSGWSHVNDSGFWLVNQYFGMTVPQTLKSWSAMKVVSAFLGLAIVLAAHAIFR
jgi:gluconate transporter